MPVNPMSPYSLTKYAQERHQFGRPIASFGLIQQKLGEMAARTFAAESATYRTAGSGVTRVISGGNLSLDSSLGTVTLQDNGTPRTLTGAKDDWEDIFVGDGFQPLLVMILPPGAFLSLGLLLAGMNKLEEKRAIHAGETYEPPQEIDCGTCVLCKLDGDPAQGA